MQIFNSKRKVAMKTLVKIFIFFKWPCNIIGREVPAVICTRLNWNGTGYAHKRWHLIRHFFAYVNSAILNIRFIVNWTKSDEAFRRNVGLILVALWGVSAMRHNFFKSLYMFESSPKYLSIPLDMHLTDENKT